jgi:hypothetical protein
VGNPRCSILLLYKERARDAKVGNRARVGNPRCASASKRVFYSTFLVGYRERVAQEVVFVFVFLSIFSHIFSLIGKVSAFEAASYWFKSIKVSKFLILFLFYYYFCIVFILTFASLASCATLASCARLPWVTHSCLGYRGLPKAKSNICFSIRSYFDYNYKNKNNLFSHLPLSS